MPVEDSLWEFFKQHRFRGKGSLSVALVITRRAIKEGLPLNPDELLAESQGQVQGLGKGSVQAILKEYGITRVLAEEAGRTSRGSINNMRKYVAFLNGLKKPRIEELQVIERWWIDRVREFFSGEPFKLKIDPSKSLRSVISDLLGQAMKRQKEMPGATYAGTVLQHLVGAKLEMMLPSGSVGHHGASVADTSTNRDGDFKVADTVLHVTTAPTEALIRKCRTNIEADKRPIIVSTQDGVQGAEALARGTDLEGRLDLFEVTQFIATNLYEKSLFSGGDRSIKIKDLVAIYNSIIDKHESDPSLRIEVGR